jgi:hypothetical protein
MKLFQIEEPDGRPVDADAPGVAVGIDIAPGGVGRIAIALGGNAEILPDGDGNRTLSLAPHRDLLLALRSRAEKQLVRPVSHAVIAVDKAEAGSVEEGAIAAGIVLLSLISRGDAARLARGATADEAPVLGAAMRAEDLAPKIE